MDTEEMKKRGIDYDLEACLEHNPQDGFDVNSIVEVMAVWEGANDEEDWRWILKLEDGRYAYLQGWCDYTGWDCQSYANSVIVTGIEEALYTHLQQDDIAGGNLQTINNHLRQQCITGKLPTWVEKTDDAMGHPNRVSIGDVMTTNDGERYIAVWETNMIPDDNKPRITVWMRDSDGLNFEFRDFAEYSDAISALVDHTPPPTWWAFKAHGVEQYIRTEHILGFTANDAGTAATWTPTD